MDTLFRALFEAGAWACYAELLYARHRAIAIATDKARPDPYWAGDWLLRIYNDRTDYNENVELSDG